MSALQQRRPSQSPLKRKTSNAFTKYDNETYKSKQYLRSTYQPHSQSNSNLNLSNIRSDKKIPLDANKQIEQLKRQNQALKNEIKWLNSYLSKEFGENCNETSLIKQIAKLEQQKDNLKRIIQKSYYSIKQMQRDHNRMSIENNEVNQKYQQIYQKIKNLQNQRTSYKTKMQLIERVHRQQVSALSQRIILMEQKLQQVMELMENQRLQWRKQKVQLSNLKKIYMTQNYGGI